MVPIIIRSAWRNVKQPTSLVVLVPVELQYTQFAVVGSNGERYGLTLRCDAGWTSSEAGAESAPFQLFLPPLTEYLSEPLQTWEQLLTSGVIPE